MYCHVDTDQDPVFTQTDGRICIKMKRIRNTRMRYLHFSSGSEEEVSFDQKMLYTSSALNYRFTVANFYENTAAIFLLLLDNVLYI